MTGPEFAEWLESLLADSGEPADENQPLIEEINRTQSILRIKIDTDKDPTAQVFEVVVRRIE